MVEFCTERGTRGRTQTNGFLTILATYLPFSISKFEFGKQASNIGMLYFMKIIKVSKEFISLYVLNSPRPLLLMFD